MQQVKFLKCDHCGKIVSVVKDSKVPLICCGESMKELVANTQDAAIEKHVPVIEVDGQTVNVTIGEVEHPMLEEHYIEWIYIHTEQGIQCKPLSPGDSPTATFALTETDKLIAAYEYCNLHGLWMAEA